MREFFVVLNQVLVLFVILFVGFIAGKKKILDPTGTKKLSELLLHVTSPMLVFSSFVIEFSQERLINIFYMVGISTCMFFIAIFLSHFIFIKFDERVRPILRFTSVFSNCGYMGLPLMKALFGDEGVLYGSFYVVIFNVFLWSYGYTLFGGKGSRRDMIRKILLNPSIIAVYIGLVVFLLRIQVPNPIVESVKAIGNMTMPLSMLIIGGVISTSRFRDVFSDWRSYFLGGIRLIVMPLLALILTRAAGLTNLPASVVVVALSMPPATNTVVFAEMFDKDSLFASRCVTLVTLLAILTAPVIAMAAMM